MSIYHSVHNDFESDNKAYAKLNWESEDQDFEIVKKIKFYTSNPPLTLKIIGYTIEDF